MPILSTSQSARIRLSKVASLMTMRSLPMASLSSRTDTMVTTVCLPALMLSFIFLHVARDFMELQLPFVVIARDLVALADMTEHLHFFIGQRDLGLESLRRHLITPPGIVRDLAVQIERAITAERIRCFVSHPLPKFMFHSYLPSGQRPRHP